MTQPERVYSHVVTGELETIAGAVRLLLDDGAPFAVTTEPGTRRRNLYLTEYGYTYLTDLEVGL